MHKISVILPVYNVKNEYLEKAVNSVLAQSISDFELLIIDDGSKAETAQNIDALAAKDGRIKVFHNKNQGPGKSRNFGLSQASGEYIIFMDHDDWVEPTWLEKLYHSIVKNNSEAAFCYANEYFEDDDKYGEIAYPHFAQEVLLLDDKLRYKMANAFFPPWAKMIRTDVIEKYELRFAEDDNRFDDVLFHVFLIEYVKKVSFVDEILYHHRMFANSITCTSFNDTDMYFDVFKTMDEVIEKCERDGSSAQDILNRNINFFCSAVDVVKSRRRYVTTMRKYIKKLKLDNILRKMMIKKIKRWFFTCSSKKKVLRIFGIYLINRNKKAV